MKKLWLEHVESHRKLSHHDMSHAEFEKLIIKSFESGKFMPKYFPNVNKGIRSGSQSVEAAKQRSKLGIRTMVSGGKVSPK